MSGAFVAAHATGASLALVLGGWQLWRKPKGDRMHRTVGRVWVVAMYWTVLSSFFIKRLSPGHYSWIHLLSIWTFISLTVGVRAAMQGRVQTHRGWIVGSYFGLVGAFIGAVAVPDRDVPQLVVHRPLVFVLATMAIIFAAASIIALCARSGPLTRRAGALRIVGLDVAGPLIVYAMCRDSGVSQVWALAISSAAPAVGVAIDWMYRRTVEIVGTVVLGGIALTIVLATMTDNPQVVLLKGAVVTGAFGLACLGSLAMRRPLIFHFAQALYGGRHTADGAELDTNYDRYSKARTFWRTSTCVWGVAYIVEGTALSIITLTSSTSVALAMNRALPWLVSAVLFAAVFRRGSRLRAEIPQRHSANDGVADRAEAADAPRPVNQASTAQSGPLTSVGSPSPAVHSLPT